MSLLDIDAVSRSFWRGPTEMRVLREVSLRVDSGELVAIYGQRNAGKTTLLKIAAGFDSPDSGSVSFDGVDLARLSGRDLAQLHRERIGWVERGGPQSHELTVNLYVALPLYRKVGKSQAQRRAAAMLAKVGAQEYANHRWDDLPDTARTLVAIAHALAREPAALVVDDPTAGLGMMDRERVVGLLRGAAEEGGVAVLMAVPDMPSMLQATQVRLLSRGRLIEPLASPDDNATVVEFPHHKRA